MENGFSTSDAILTQAMSGGFGNNRGGGSQWGGSGYGYHTGNQVLAAEAHANGTATKEAIDCNAIRFTDGLNSLSSSFENQTRANQIDSVTKNLTDAEFRNSDRFSNAEFRSIDRQRDIERILVDNAKEAAACCCETQKLILAEGNETRALVLAVEGRTNVAALAAAQARINQLETINALDHHRRH